MKKFQCDVCGEMFEEKNVTIVNNSGTYCHKCMPPLDVDFVIDCLKDEGKYEKKS